MPGSEIMFIVYLLYGLFLSHTGKKRFLFILWIHCHRNNIKKKKFDSKNKYFRRIYDKQEEKSKLFQLEQAVVKCMRGILFAMMGQSHKVNKDDKIHK